jgi:Leucine-rich repeat (LRR) protein
VNSFNILENVTAKEVSCEEVVDRDWGDLVGWVKICGMQTITVINESNITIAMRDDKMGGLTLGSNRNINYLPVLVVEKFPNLLAFYAIDCNIKEISKKNFAGLNKLKLLQLHGNQIKKINSDTFEDLILLENLSLGKKKKEAFCF